MALLTRYSQVHTSPQGPGDARPTALQIVQDEDLVGKLTDKTFIVTGCTSGIGVETARALYATGAKLFITVRDIEKGKELIKDIESGDFNNPNGIELLYMELDSLDSVRAAVKEFLSKSSTLNLLVCNAGVMATPEGKTKDGFETQFGVNHLSHFLLFQLLKQTLLDSSTPDFPSRVVTVTSGAHRITPPIHDDYNFEKNAYDPWKSYGQSKSANIWMTNEIDRRYGAKGLHATSISPGLIWSGLQKHVSDEVKKGWEQSEIWKPLWKTPAQGAATTVWAGIGKVWSDQGGKVLHDCQVWPSTEEDPAEGYAAHAFDPEGESILWRNSCTMVGINDDI
ncbi:hypothetical protein ABW19_dt0202302 [Dactylella cylindrospora]|nr:hypothetical protein ABW19_dt0202302 [Dactylella cylindrospora]